MKKCLLHHVDEAVSITIEFDVTASLLANRQDVQINRSCRNGHDGTIETVEHAAVSRKDVARILDAQLALHQRFGQIAPGAEHYYCDAHAYPCGCRHDREEMSQCECCRYAEYTASDGTFP